MDGRILHEDRGRRNTPDKLAALHMHPIGRRSRRVTGTEARGSHAGLGQKAAAELGLDLGPRQDVLAGHHLAGEDQGRARPGQDRPGGEPRSVEHQAAE